MKTKVTTRGQVSIPASIRAKFNIEPESSVDWVVEGNALKVIPLPKDPVAAFKGRGSRKYTGTKLLKDRRRERKEESARD